MALRIVTNCNLDASPEPSGGVLFQFQDVLFEDESMDIRMLGDKEAVVLQRAAWEQVRDKIDELFAAQAARNVQAVEHELTTATNIEDARRQAHGQSDDPRPGS
jgi:hypothetical protein